MNTIPINSITVGEGRRPLRDVSELAASIREIGLLNPITVTKEHRLVAGYHRLEACKSLGWTDIPATIVALDATDAELAEIDENLVRRELSVLERGEHLLRRKRLYETKHPETRRGVAGGKARQGAAMEIASFADDTAAKMGVTSRTIRQEVQITEKIAVDVKSVIRDTELADNKTALLALSRCTPDIQRGAIRQWLAGEDLELAIALEEAAQVITEGWSGLAKSGREIINVRDELCRTPKGEIDNYLFEQACYRVASKANHPTEAVLHCIRICIAVAQGANTAQQ